MEWVVIAGLAFLQVILSVYVSDLWRRVKGLEKALAKPAVKLMENRPTEFRNESKGGTMWD